ncbi:hypothetical protein [Bergeriella denitrificans]|uniref:Lipoprotein n=1 Tax=Bergeriella denitrificans TaxID=494 RepID=A0A378UEK1_BERDE|nr:hypothetical protein [Bergeriella denitrificans]STZ75838.1 Uncharacterised protein [Bergeriella denitrificans]
MNKFLLGTLILTPLLAACSGSQPDDELYTKTINRFAKEQGVCLPLALNVQHSSDRNVLIPIALGSSEIKIAAENRKGQTINRTALAQLDILADEGLYKKTKENKPIKQDSDETIPIVIYTLTEEGQQRSHVRKDESPLFCVGRMEVTKIHASALSQQTGRHLTARVDYESKFIGETWLPELLEAGGLQKLPLTPPGIQTAILVETDDGWKDVRETR